MPGNLLDLEVGDDHEQYYRGGGTSSISRAWLQLAAESKLSLTTSGRDLSVSSRFGGII